MKDLNKARNYVYFLLARRAYSQYELKTKLQSKQYSPEIIAATLEFFQQADLLDDAAFAHNYLQYRCHRKGRKILAWELKQKGISEEIIQAELLLITPEAELESALKLAGKKFPDPKTDPNKIARFLWQKGFSQETVSRAKQIIQENELP